MSKPKFSINERVMVRCHSSKEASGKSQCLDDCRITQSVVIRAGETVTYRDSDRTLTKDHVYYTVDQLPEKWIDEPFIFPYQQPGSSFKEQMQELDRPIKQLEPA